MVCSFQGAFTSTSVLQEETKSPINMAKKARGLGWKPERRKAVRESKKFKAENWWTRG
jgi:hypothetical protein